MKHCGGWKAALTLVSLGFLAGCAALMPPAPRLDGVACLYEKAQLSYEVETDRVARLPDRPADAQLVSYSPQAPDPLPPKGQAAVDVAYPHPEGRKGYAQVNVRVDFRGEEPHSALRRPRGAWAAWWQTARGRVAALAGQTSAQESWTLDITEAELAEIIGQLRAGGYFDSYGEAGEAAQVRVELDGNRHNRAWHQVPGLDALVMRARTEGRLVSSTRPPSTPVGPADSVLAYRELFQDEESGVALASDSPAATGALITAAPQIVRLPAVGAVRR